MAKDKKIFTEDLAAALRTPFESGNVGPIKTLEDVKKFFALPRTMAYDSKDPAEAERLNAEKLAQDSAFEFGFTQIFESLMQHSTDLGQYPSQSFIGYGALQQIAQNGMIRTAIQTVADDITREWITITGGDETDNELLDTLAEKMDGLNIRRLYNRAYATQGYMGGAFIYIDTGTDDPSLPLQISDKSDEIKQGTKVKFVLIDPVVAAPGVYNASDPLKENYMSDPDYWLILGRRVHHSRLIILRDNLPPTLLRPAYNFLGIPQAQILWDYVLHWNRARVSVAGILEKLNLLVYQTNTEDLLTSSDGVQQMDAKMLALSRYRNNDSVVVCDRNAEDIKNITLTISGVTDIVRQQLEFIAAINRTPAVKLLGISPSGFNATGESDIRNYYDHVMSKQELLRDGIQKILDIIQLTTTGTIDPSISFEFNALGADDDQADVQTAAARVNMLNSLLQTNVLSAEEVRKAVKEDKKTKLGFIPDDLPQPNAGAEVGTAEDLAEDPAIKSLWMLGEPAPKTAAEPEIDQNVIANWMVEHESDAPQA